MTYWKFAYDIGWIERDKEAATTKLRLAVITESNPYGEITAEQY